MGARAVPVDPLAGRSGESAATLITRLRTAHQEMVEAALAGDGIARVAELASARVGRPVGIVAPAEGVAVVSSENGTGDRLGALERYVADHLNGEPTELPAQVEVVVPITSGKDTIGTVAMFSGTGSPVAEAGEFLHLAAITTMTTLALEQAREHEAARLGGGLVEELRRGELKSEEVVRRAARLGCDLARGALVIVTEVRSSRPRQAMALITQEHAQSICELAEGRIYAVLAAGGVDESAEATVATARKLAERLRSYGPTGVSSYYSDPADLRRAIGEAELVVEVVSRDERMAEQLSGGIGSGVYRLLFQALASHPEEVRSFYEDTVAAVVRYDEQYHSELRSTLEAYLANDCNMNATARRIFAHRHTVAYRLGQVKDLTGLDPLATEDRERLSLGLKAYRIVAPTLPR